jgi:hypothetical protein
LNLNKYKLLAVTTEDIVKNQDQRRA